MVFPDFRPPANSFAQSRIAARLPGSNGTVRSAFSTCSSKWAHRGLWWLLMRRYLKVTWHHDFPDEPSVLYSEIDAGYEIRKVDVYRDGTHDFADGRIPNWVEQKRAGKNFTQLLVVVLAGTTDLVMIG